MRTHNQRSVRLANGGGSALIQINSSATILRYRLSFGLPCGYVQGCARHLAMPRNRPGSIMCLAIPMQIVAIDGFVARCSVKGVERDVSLFMMQDEALAPGDFVVVHVGYAIQKIKAEDARIAWDIYDAMLQAEDAASHA
jgi:hydrogenase expression/formation protein HypC